jgi:hypothetical protein
MTYQRAREEFLITTASLLRPSEAYALLRCATTLQRLAEAQCNGDWPADNGTRSVAVCPQCEGYWAPTSINASGCPDCRAEARVRTVLAATSLRPVFGRDPRGAVLRLVEHHVSEADVECGRERGICVPARTPR